MKIYAVGQDEESFVASRGLFTDLSLNRREYSLTNEGLGSDNPYFFISLAGESYPFSAGLIFFDHKKYFGGFLDRRPLAPCFDSILPTQVNKPPLDICCFGFEGGILGKFTPKLKELSLIFRSPGFDEYTKATVTRVFDGSDGATGIYTGKAHNLDPKKLSSYVKSRIEGDPLGEIRLASTPVGRYFSEAYFDTPLQRFISGLNKEKREFGLEVKISREIPTEFSPSLSPTE